MKKQPKDNGISSIIHNWYRKALKHTKYRWFVILGTLFYLVSPLDISPDVFPIIGWIDDGIIVSLLITEVSQIMSEELKRKRLFQNNSTVQNTTKIDLDSEIDAVKTITVDAVAIS